MFVTRKEIAESQKLHWSGMPRAGGEKGSSGENGRTESTGAFSSRKKIQKADNYNNEGYLLH